jgi:flagellar basal-body rod protein FlgB
MSILSKILFNQTSIPLLKRSLDASNLRQKVISNNLANIGTPGYDRREVSFEDQLRKAMHRDGVQGRTTDPRHIPIGHESVAKVMPEVLQVTDQSETNGVNNVDVDQEMTALAKNQILFNTAARLAAARFKGLRKAITGRSG